MIKLGIKKKNHWKNKMILQVKKVKLLIKRMNSLKSLIKMKKNWEKDWIKMRVNMNNISYNLNMPHTSLKGIGKL